MQITNNAALKIKTFDEPFLRIEVIGGGCSGFQYVFSLTDARNSGDLEFSKDGAVVIIDPTYQDMLADCILDFESHLAGARFKIVNPNAKLSCGCGNSFTV